MKEQPVQPVRGPKPRTIQLTDEERAKLEELARRQKTANAMARRARIVLGAADGLGNAAIAKSLGVGRSTAAKYRLGIAYRELGRVEEALVILQSIQRETEFIVLCLNAIGLCLRRQGLDTAAAKRFQKAIETPGYPEHQYNDALYNLGDLYEAKKDPESLALSLSSYEELYARDCTFRDIADRIKSVKSKLGAAEGPKVKRLPNRSEASNDR